MAVTSISQDDLKNFLRYDEATGHFTWIGRPPVRRDGKIDNRIDLVGKIAGAKTNNGYISIKVDGHHYLAHRLAWFYVHGRWPVEMVDHINCNKSDNRLVNLREATRAQNRANCGLSTRNSSGFKGITRYGPGGWKAQIAYRGNTFHIGKFATPKRRTRPTLPGQERSTAIF